MFLVILLSFCMMIVCLAFVASNPSPSLSTLGFVFAVVAGCVLLACLTGCFLSLVYLLVYLGGMLVVFGYSAAMAVEIFPEGLGSVYALISFIFFLLMSFFTAFVLWCKTDGPMNMFLGPATFKPVQNNTGGAGWMYWCGGVLLVLGAIALLLGLFVVFEMAWGLGYAALISYIK